MLVPSLRSLALGSLLFTAACGDAFVGGNGDDSPTPTPTQTATPTPGATPALITADWTADGDLTSAHLGRSVSSAGDVNGDGIADLLVGADQYSNGESTEGRVYLFLGSATGPSVTPVWHAEVDQSSARLGDAVASADVNGDGYDDVLVSAKRFDAGQGDEGRVLLYLGGPAGPAAVASWTAESDQAGAWFGTSVASAGDVNGDGYPDVAIGAPYFDTPATNAGRVYVYFGSPTGLGSTPWSADGVADSLLGGEVAGAGDVDGDGYDDLLVGADSTDDDGHAHLFRGGPSGPSATPDWTITSMQQADHLGVSVAGAGDVDGDGFADVLVGAYGHDDDLAEQGAVFLYRGGPDGLGATPDWTAKGSDTFAWLGMAVAGGGDVNGDGFADVAMVASQPSGIAKAFVFHGSANGLLPAASWYVRSEETDSDFGATQVAKAISIAGDLDGDGDAELVVGAHGAGGTNTGRVYLYEGDASR